MKIAVLLVFHKDTRQFIAAVRKNEDSSLLNRQDFLYKEVEVEEEIFDKGVLTWRGSYDDGYLTTEVEQALFVLETEINQKCCSQILKAYPIEEQLKIIIDELYSMPYPKSEQFLRMFHFINETRLQNKRRKQEFKTNPKFKFVTTREEIEKINERLDKGGFEARGVHDIDKPFEVEDIL